MVSRRKPHGKGANVTAAVEAVIDRGDERDRRPSCSATPTSASRRGQLGPWSSAVESGDCDLAVAAFRDRVGGGFGIALGFARWAIERRCGYRAGAPISGQRAMSAEVLRAVVPFAPGYGMEPAMTIDAVRAGYRLREVELDLAHRATGRTVGGFLHRARQLWDFGRAYVSSADLGLAPVDPRHRPGHDRAPPASSSTARAGSPGARTRSSSSTFRGPAGSSTTRARSGR